MRVHGAIAKGAQAIMFRILRPLRQLQQGQERFLKDVLGFTVTETQSASVEDQSRRFPFIKRLAPSAVDLRFIHALTIKTAVAPLISIHRHQPGQICIKKFANPRSWDAARFAQPCRWRWK